MEFEQAREYVKRYVPITRFSGETDRNGFCTCPFCNSGQGEHQTPAFKVFPDSNKFKCFSCGEHGDVIDLYMKVTNTNHGRAVRELANSIGIEVDGQAKSGKAKVAQVVPPPPKPKVKKPTPHKDYTTFLNIAHGNVKKTDYFQKRGLTPETISRFRLGFKPDYKTFRYKNGQTIEKDIPVVIIPYNRKNSYFIAHAVRDEDMAEGLKHFKPRNNVAGPEPVYNVAILGTDKPVFVCESPLDAISIMQAGGNALAVGGTGTSKLVEAVKENRPQKPLILSMDNDSHGAEAMNELAKEFDKLDVSYVTADYNLDKFPPHASLKDANEMLIADPKVFEEEVQRIQSEVELSLEQPVQESEELDEGMSREDEISERVFHMYYGAVDEQFNKEKPMNMTADEKAHWEEEMAEQESAYEGDPMRQYNDEHSYEEQPYEGDTEPFPDEPDNPENRKSVLESLYEHIPQGGSPSQGSGPDEPPHS